LICLLTLLTSPTESVAVARPFTTHLLYNWAESHSVADVLQIGARNMQNFSLLKKVGVTGKPVLLKRGMSATIQEWLMAAEYILATGNPNVILCERGIRTFDKQYTRNTLDVSVIPVLRELTHLPIMLDPSHGTGKSQYVPSMALSSIAAGADSLMIEVHPNPAKASKPFRESFVGHSMDCCVINNYLVLLVPKKC